MATSPLAEHRGIRRIAGDTVGPLQLRSEATSMLFLAEVRDVSIQGIGLLAPQPFVQGTPLVIEAGPKGNGLATKLIATVRHFALMPDGRWLLGCMFSRPLTSDDFDVLG